MTREETWTLARQEDQLDPMDSQQSHLSGAHTSAHTSPIHQREEELQDEPAGADQVPRTPPRPQTSGAHTSAHTSSRDSNSSSSDNRAEEGLETGGLVISQINTVINPLVMTSPNGAFCITHNPNCLSTGHSV